jgi:beta-N-acetylhexosaminidase
VSSFAKAPVVAAFLTVLLLASCASPEPRPPETASVEVASEEADDLPLASAAEEESAALDRLVESHLESMTLREKIAQRFITYIEGTTVGADINIELRDNAPAGYILYPWNYDTFDDVQSLTTNLQRVCRWHNRGMDLLICADQEGGRVQAFRFPELATLPAAYWMGLHRDPDLVEAAAYLTAVQLRWLGVNMSLSPVLDLYDTPDSSIIGDRSYGPDADIVSSFASAYVRGFSRAGVIATAKHFPGHGASTIDSHGRMPVVDLSIEELMATHVRPFRAAVDEGVDVVMTAHIIYPRIDPVFPATLSEVLIHETLRGELDFGGVVMSDGLEMGALEENYPIEVTLAQAIRSGVDLILLYTRYDMTEMVDIVEFLVEDATLSEAQIDAGVRRILRLKARYGLLSEP